MENSKNYLIKPDNPEKEYLASMGIYIFNAKVIEECLDSNHTDFGKEVIPEAIKNYKVSAFLHNGYWYDIGIIMSFYDAPQICLSQRSIQFI